MKLSTLLLLIPLTACAETGVPISHIDWADGDSGAYFTGSMQGVEFRLSDIDAPETWRYGCDSERDAGYAAKRWVKEQTRNASVSKGEYYGFDDYGREVIDLIVNGQDLGTMGLALGHYRPWVFVDGVETMDRPEWCS